MHSAFRMRVLVAAILLSATGSLVMAQSMQGAQVPDLSQGQKAEIDALFEAYDAPATPGCALGVIRDGRFTYARGYGMADLERHVPITPATLFDIGSMSKQFTAAAVLLLVQQGKLSLSDDLRRYVPEMPNYGTPITINELMWHTSGIRDYASLLPLSGVSYEEVVTDEEALAVLARQRGLNFKPGSQFEYSNSGYFLLSLIVQRAAKEPFAHFVAQQVFRPLHMATTVIRSEHAMVIPNRALGYTPGTNGAFEVAMSNWESAGDGSVQTSIDDILKWDRNFYTGRVGGGALGAQLAQPGRLSNGTVLPYGRGLLIDRYRGLPRVYHGGRWIGYDSSLERFPNQHTSIAVFCNNDSINAEHLSEKIADIVLAGRFRGVSPATPRVSASAFALTDIHRFTGHYFAEERDEFFRIVDVKGTLGLQIGPVPIPLVQTGPRTFMVRRSSVTLTFTAGGRVTARGFPDGETALSAVRFTPSTPGAAMLRAYAGSYYSRELDVTWKVSVRQGRLSVMKPAGKFLSEVTPLRGEMPDLFSGDREVLRFRRNASGRVVGFDLSALRTRGIRFVAVPDSCSR